MNQIEQLYTQLEKNHTKLRNVKRFFKVLNTN